MRLIDTERPTEAGVASWRKWNWKASGDRLRMLERGRMGILHYAQRTPGDPWR